MDAKADYDASLARLEERHKAEKFEESIPLRLRVKEALQAGVSLRKIGLDGLGTKNYDTWADYADTPIVSPELSLSVAIVPSFLDNKFTVIDSNRLRWAFTIEAFDAGYQMVELDTRQPDKRVLGSPVPEEVKAAIAEGYPDMDLTALDEEEPNADY